MLLKLEAILVTPEEMTISSLRRSVWVPALLFAIPALDVTKTIEARANGQVLPTTLPVIGAVKEVLQPGMQRVEVGCPTTIHVCSIVFTAHTSPHVTCKLVDSDFATLCYTTGI